MKTVIYEKSREKELRLKLFPKVGGGVILNVVDAKGLQKRSSSILSISDGGLITICAALNPDLGIVMGNNSRAAVDNT